MSMNMDNSQESGCKIFVGGLTWNTDKEMLQGEFSKYGEIIDSIVMKNPETGNSRGFGFITYSDNNGAEMAVNSGSHKIDGKIVDVKLCNPRLAAQQRSSKQRNENCKVFVGGLPHGVSDDEIKQFFSRYGNVKEFKMMYDENKQRPRGFGFITFDAEESANQVLKEHYIQFNGKQIEVKPQIHNARQQSMNPNGMHGGGMQHQGHFGNGGGGGMDWNQNSWNSNGGIGGQLGSNMGNSNVGGWGVPQLNGAQTDPNQGWGQSAGAIDQGAYPQHGSYQNNSNAPQSNWSFNYYGQPQGYYPADSSGTGTFNF